LIQISLFGGRTDIYIALIQVIRLWNLSVIRIIFFYDLEWWIVLLFLFEDVLDRLRVLWTSLKGRDRGKRLIMLVLFRYIFSAFVNWLFIKIILIILFSSIFFFGIDFSGFLIFVGIIRSLYSIYLPLVLFCLFNIWKVVNFSIFIFFIMFLASYFTLSYLQYIMLLLCQITLKDNWLIL